MIAEGLQDDIRTDRHEAHIAINQIHTINHHFYCPAMASWTNWNYSPKIRNKRLKLFVF